MSSFLQDSQSIYPTQTRTSSKLAQNIREKYNFAATTAETVRQYIAEAKRILELDELVLDEADPQALNDDLVTAVQDDVAKALERSRNPSPWYQLSCSLAIDGDIHQNDSDPRTASKRGRRPEKPHLTRRSENITWKIIKWKQQGLPADEAEYEQWARDFKESKFSDQTRRNDRTALGARKTPKTREDEVSSCQ